MFSPEYPEASVPFFFLYFSLFQALICLFDDYISILHVYVPCYSQVCECPET